eukprot:Opistho-1_new@88462
MLPSLPRRGRRTSRRHRRAVAGRIASRGAHLAGTGRGDAGSLRLPSPCRQLGARRGGDRAAARSLRSRSHRAPRAAPRSGAMNAPALILAAGRGERMRPLTDHTPKPLLPVHGKPLIEWQLEALARDGVRHVVINTAWLEEQFPATLGDGSRFGLSIRYSMEGRRYGGALETAGGIATALPLLQSDTFWVMAGDAYMPGFHFDAHHVNDFMAGGDLAHLWLVPNPPQHPRGDFGLSDKGRILAGDDAAVKKKKKKKKKKYSALI